MNGLGSHREEYHKGFDKVLSSLFLEIDGESRNGVLDVNGRKAAVVNTDKVSTKLFGDLERQHLVTDVEKLELAPKHRVDGKIVLRKKGSQEEILVPDIYEG